MSEPLREPLIYAEDQCDVRWPLFLLSIVVTTAAVLGFLLLVDLAVTLPPMWGLVFFALTPLMWVFHFVRTASKGRQRTGIRIYSHEIRIGGLQRFERLQREGRWPPRRGPTVTSPYRAVFSCQWQNVRDLYLITGRRELKAIVKQHRLPADSPHARQLPLGFLPAPWMRAALVIGHRPLDGAMDPDDIPGVTSAFWLIPTHHPEKLRTVLRQVPDAPAVLEGPPSA